VSTASDIKKLNAELAKAQQDKDELRDKAGEAGMRARDIADQIAALEQQHGDEQALAALRDRGGVDGAMAARGIAATMPDPDRARRFEDLARELLDR
jgi:predicted  nucleic acid-binding Zn-ribbon protein